MSTKAQKLFAKYISTKNKQERDAFGRKLKQMRVKNADLYYVSDGQKFTIHGNIPVGNRETKAKPQRAKSRRGEVAQAKQATRERAKSTRYSDFDDTQPKRTGWIKLTPTPPKRTREEFQRQESDFVARSVIRRRNKGLF